MAAAPDIVPPAEKFPELVLATWTADGSLSIPLAVTSVRKHIENTLVKQRRPYQDGAKLDNMGLDVVVWTLAVDFYNGCQEPGIPRENYYPDYLNALELTVSVQKTGTLTIGRDGPVRGQIKSLDVAEMSEARDSAAVQIIFWQDREDGVTAANFQPSAASALPALGADIYDEALDAGVWTEDVPALVDAVGTLSSVLSSATDVLGDALAAAALVIGTAELIEELTSASYDTTAPAGASLALDCDAATMILFLRRTRDRAADTRAVLLAQTPRTVGVKFPTVVSIFDVAARYGQDLEDLIALNTGKLDPGEFYAIPVGREVLIKAAA